jgi:hypothetical protein
VEIPSCVYEFGAKMELVKRINELKAKGNLVDRILGALSADEQVPEILRRLKIGETYDIIVEWLGRAQRHEYDVLSRRNSQQCAFETSDQEMESISSFQWTSVTSDLALLDHLFQLYFSWVHPVHTLFSEGHFVDSYRRQSNQYCSSILVNSICAMACHLCTNPEAAEVDFELLGYSFSDAVLASVDVEDRRITTIQAFAVLFMVYCTRGTGLRGSRYLDMARISLLEVVCSEIEGFSEVLMNTSRGIRGLCVYVICSVLLCKPR